MSGEDEKINELISEIAVKNGVAVGKRDPIMIVYTMNNKLLKDGKEAQQEILNIFKSELESIAHQWGEEAKGKAERVLNAALEASRVAMANEMQLGAKKASEDLRKVIGAGILQLERLADSSRRAAYVNLIASILVVLSIIIALFKGI